MHSTLAGFASLVAMMGRGARANPRLSDFHPRQRADVWQPRSRYLASGVTFIREGRAERKERRRQLREINRWLGTKPGQRGEKPAGTGRRQKHKRPPHSRARANARRNARRAAAARGR